MVVGLIIIGVITVGVNTDVDPVLVESSGLLEPSLLGWQLLYILPVAIFTNVFFISVRTFSSCTTTRPPDPPSSGPSYAHSTPLRRSATH